MKNRLDPAVRLRRIKMPGFVAGDDNNGAFTLAHHGKLLLVIVSNGAGWEHMRDRAAILCDLRALVWALTVLAVLVLGK